MNIRTRALSAAIAPFADAALILSETNRFYYTGFAASDGALLVSPALTVFYTDSRYTEAAENKLGKEAVRDSGRLYEDLAAVFESNGIERVAIEADRVTLSQFVELQKKLPGVTLVSDDALTKEINAERAVKAPEEVGAIVEAQRIAERALDTVLGLIRPGMTEKEIALKLEYEMLSKGAEALSFETICVSGANSSLPHGVPGNKKVENGDFITMDFGAVVRGYHSDMTRTVALGRADGEMRRVYATVLEAQTAALAAMADGTTCFDADKAARDVIGNAGYGAYFGHGTGHGVGVEIHEKPNVSPRGADTLKTGNVVTAEPGIYLPGRFGVRIEDMALITASGCENLTKAPKELIIL